MGFGGSDFDAVPYAAQANKILQQALDLGLPYAENYTAQAIQAQERATEQARNDAEAGYQRAQAVNAPYTLAGYNALDTYLDTLTVARPEMGSYKLATALERSAERDQALDTLRTDVQAVRDKYAGGMHTGIGEFVDKDGNVIPIGNERINNAVMSGEATYVPGLYAQSGAGLYTDQLANNYYLDFSKQGGMASLNGLPPLNEYMPGNREYQMRDIQQGLLESLSKYRADTANFTPEQGQIANSYKQGLLGEAQWKNVGAPNPYMQYDGVA